MIKKLAKSVREFRTPAMLTPVFVVGEVLMEALIPYLIALLVNDIRSGAGTAVILNYAWKLIALSLISLFCGYMAGINCARASTGFARNLRADVFRNIQGFSFSNIDKFSSASLVTLLFSFFMAFYMGGKMALIFVVIIPFLAFGLLAIAKSAMPIFRKAFPMYDKLNNSVEENVKGIRVVKAFVREDYEIEKFRKDSENIRTIFTKAERLLALNGPLMQTCMYSVMLFVLYVGSRQIIATNGVALDIGQFSTLLTYSVQILTSLMMISFLFVMMTFSAESAQRVCEALDEKSTITSP